MNRPLSATPVPARPAEEGTARKVAEFEIKYHQFLDPAGRLNGPLPEFARDPVELLKMYKLMTLVRTFDREDLDIPAFLRRTRNNGKS